jgi:hypothetical protein
MTGSLAMEAAASQVTRIFDTLTPADQGALFIRLAMITALKAEDTEDYLMFLPDIVRDAIRAHLAGQPGHFRG